MRGDEDGDAAFGEIVDEIPEASAVDRINAGGRLIEEDDGRLVEDGAAEGKALFPAAGEERG